MAEGEVTSRQDGGVHTWDVDAATAGDGMTRSAVRRSYLRLRARPTGQGPAYVPVATAVNAQYRPRPVLRSFGRGAAGGNAVLALLFRPPRDGKCAVSALTHRHEAQFRSRRSSANTLGGWPTCCAVSAPLIRAAGDPRSLAYW
jgi:hypothetical protein